MPYVDVSGSKKKKKNNISISKIYFLLFLILIIIFALFQIARQVSLYNDMVSEKEKLEIQLNELKKTYNQKNEIKEDLEKKLKEKGVEIDNGAINRIDIYNFPQT
ncbi:MAG TPA: hypothetical protein PLS66_03600 [Tepiditoga sp.]|nr:hypothetical protein [Tepiditoga sp.]